MFCSVYNIGGVNEQTCNNAKLDGVEACVLCDGHGREPYPDPMPHCGCGRLTNHPGKCAERQAFFDAHRSPTDGEKSFIRNLLSGMEPGKALEASSLDTTTNPDRKASRLVQLPHIKRYVADILDQAGGTDLKIAKTIVEGMDANNIQMRLEKRSEKGVKTEEVITHEAPDWPSRLRAAELALKAKGYMDRDDGSRPMPTKVTIVNKFSKNQRDEDDDDQIIEVTSAG